MASLTYPKKMESNMSNTELPETQVIVTGRLSYADLFRARKFKTDAADKPGRYKTDVLIPKNTEQGKKDLAAIKAAAAAAKKEKWGDKIPPLGADRLCLKDGDTTGREEHRGHWVLKASETEAPQLIDRDGRTELTESDGKLYSGCVARVMVNLWAQDNDFGKRINANLRGVQFVAHGEPFGKGRISAKEAFGSLEDEDADDLGFGEIGEDEVDSYASGLL